MRTQRLQVTLNPLVKTIESHVVTLVDGIIDHIQFGDVTPISIEEFTEVFRVFSRDKGMDVIVDDDGYTFYYDQDIDS